MKKLIITSVVLLSLASCGTRYQNDKVAMTEGFPEIENALLASAVKTNCELNVDQAAAVLKSAGIRHRSELRNILVSMEMRKKARAEEGKLVMTFGSCAHRLKS